MGYKADQRLPSEIEGVYRPREPPPALPPRGPREEAEETLHLAGSSTEDFYPPTYDKSQTDSLLGSSAQNRSIHDGADESPSTLLPQESGDGRRKLLLIYIHGFVGNETSFAEFPAHVHTIATERLAETHVVYSKVYPRYKTRDSIEFVRDQFSKWLGPHESANTDVILLGHSMGGMLAAEVTLLRSPGNLSVSKHGILGTLNLDAPFLGMHPSVIKSGLASLFKGAPEAETAARQRTAQGIAVLPVAPSETSLERQSTTQSIKSQSSNNSVTTSLGPRRSRSPTRPDPTDPYYNPAFDNDAGVPNRKGFESIMHFAMKHSDNLLGAGKSFVSSHLQYGGTMADYTTLNARYKRIRALEDEKDEARSDGRRRRIRFVNCYSVCSGRPNKAKLSGTGSEAGENGRIGSSIGQSSLGMDGEQDRNDDTLTLAQTTSTRSGQSWKSASMGDTGESFGIRKSIESDDSFQSVKDQSGDELTAIHPEAWEAAEDQDSELPPEPEKVLPFDASLYSDKVARKTAEKEYMAKIKAYDQALKEREALIKEIEAVDKLVGQIEEVPGVNVDQGLSFAQKVELLKQLKTITSIDLKNWEKLEKAKVKAEEKTLKAEHARREKERMREEKARTMAAKKAGKEKQVGAAEIMTGDRANDGKPAKSYHFCSLPSKNSQGVLDATWIPVFIADVDEVGAHCGLFREELSHYAEFVEKTAAKVVEWVAHDAQIRQGRA